MNKVSDSGGSSSKLRRRALVAQAETSICTQQRAAPVQSYVNVGGTVSGVLKMQFADSSQVML